MNDAITVYFALDRGITQGSTLAPVLHNAFVNDLAESLSSIRPIRWVTDDMVYKFKIVQHADDIVVLDRNRTHVQELLDGCYSHAVANKYSFNCAKRRQFPMRNILWAERTFKEKDFWLTWNPYNQDRKEFWYILERTVEQGRKCGVTIEEARYRSPLSDTCNSMTLQATIQVQVLVRPRCCQGHQNTAPKDGLQDAPNAIFPGSDRD